MKKIYYLIAFIFIISNFCCSGGHPKGYWINFRIEKTSNISSKKKVDLQSHLIRIKGNRYKIFRQNNKNSISKLMGKKIYQKIKTYEDGSISIQDENYLKFYRKLSDSLKFLSSNKVVLENKTFIMKVNNKIDTLHFTKENKLEYTEFGQKNSISYNRIREKGFDIILIDKPLNTFVIRNETNDKVELTTIAGTNKNIKLEKIQ